MASHLSHKEHHVYRQFGYFDLLCLCECAALSPNTKDFRLQGVTEVVQAPCIGWVDEKTRFSLPTTELTQYPLLAVQFLHLASEHLSSLGALEGAIQSLSKQTDKNLTSSFYTTLGFSDIVVISAGSDLEALMKNASTVALQLEAGHTTSQNPLRFSSSLTLFHVAQRFLDGDSAMPEVTGRMTAEVWAAVDLRRETDALKVWPRELFGEPTYVFGSHDWKGRTSSEYQAGEIARALWKTREYMPDSPFYSTITIPEANQDVGARQPVDDSSPRAYTTLPRLLKDLELASQSATRLVDAFGDTDALSVRLHEFLRLVYEISSDRTAVGALSDLEPYLEFMSTHLANLADDLSNRDLPFDHRQTLKAELTQLLRITITGLQQRYPNVEALLRGRPGKCWSPTQIGLNRVILAMGALPRFLYESTYRVVRPEGKYSRWTGFVAFGDEYEFYRWSGEVLTHPTDAVWDPLSRWHVVTHEVAHGLAEFMEISREKEFQEVADRLLGYLSTNGSRSRRGYLSRMLNELLAHWIDAQCFYGGDSHRLIRAMWHGWQHVPRVWWNATDYLTRTILLFAYDEISRWIQESPRDQAVYCRMLSDRIVELIRGLVEINEPRAVEVIQAKAGQASIVAAQLLPFVSYLFASRKRLKDIQIEVYKGDDTAVRNEIQQVLRGKPVLGGVTNPLRLLMDLTVISERDVGVDRWKANIALVYSLADDHLVRLKGSKKG